MQASQSIANARNGAIDVMNRNCSQLSQFLNFGNHQRAQGKTSKSVQVFLRGGLGNQLFQYAAGLYFSQKYALHLIMRTDLLPAREDSIGGVSRWPVQINAINHDGSFLCQVQQPPGGTHLLSKTLQVQRMVGDWFPALLIRLGVLAGEKLFAPDLSTLPKVSVVNSYCLSKVPAEHLGNYLRRQISEIQSPSFRYRELARESMIENPITVHVRLGDYKGMRDKYGNTDFSRLEKTLDRIREGNPAPTWLFTDSPQDVDKHITRRLKITKVIGPDMLSRPVEILLLLASGSHLVCANSTLSWWAAFLRGVGNTVSYPLTKHAKLNIFSADMIFEGWEPF